QRHGQYFRIRRRRDCTRAHDCLAGRGLSVVPHQFCRLALRLVYGSISVDRCLLDLLLRTHSHLGLARGFVLLFAAGLPYGDGSGAARRTPDRTGDRRRHRNPGWGIYYGAGLMVTFGTLLRTNPNYRYTWIGQVVSEIGDHFNNIAVFSLALANTRS